MTSTISFPGLGIGEFTINRTAFTIFGINVQWYGLILTTGILVAFILFYRRAIKTERLTEDDVLNVTLLTVPISIIGARIVYVLTTWSDGKYKTFYDVIAIWEGGIAIYGAILFGLATVIIYCRIRKLNTLSLLDALAPAVMMGQIIGRWGNFVNAEAYGWSEGVEKLPWRMTVGNVYIDNKLRPDIQFVHPTFLYESLWNLVGFIIIQLIYRKKKANGEIFSLYMLWYGFGRGFIECSVPTACTCSTQASNSPYSRALSALSAVRHFSSTFSKRAKNRMPSLPNTKRHTAPSIPITPSM